jgi:hypothetical protein
MRRQAALPFAIFALCATVYALVLGERGLRPSPDNHFVHLADSFLHGQLDVVGTRPPGNNDWARYDGKWYVSFPAFPAVVILPAVAIWGTAVWDRLFWAILAGLAPALLFVLLRRLAERHGGARSTRDNLLLTGLFAFGTVFFYVAVQGTVWFAAHVVASSLICLYLLFSLDAKQPWLAGLMLGLSFMTRTTTALLVLFFVIETFATQRKTEGDTRAFEPSFVGLARWFAGGDLKRVLRTGLVFALPIVILSALQLWMNAARFGSPFAFGHEYLQIRWKTRIDTWGLFNYHYLSKNLAIYLASLPWLTAAAPHVKVSLHGLALWFTTPNLLLTLWPKRVDARVAGLYAATAAVALLNLCYQNSGWIQFGYRFALDYMPLLFVLLALGARRFGTGFVLCGVFALLVNAFGALTFDRVPAFYDDDRSQNRVFQPD